MTPLESLARPELVSQARDLGIARPELMTRGELLRAMGDLEAGKASPSATSPGWFGVARELLASIIEQGLNLPDAASLIRGQVKLTQPPHPPAPVATVTLAQIYAAQGHPDKALATLRELLAHEPEHEEAARLLRELEASHSGPIAPQEPEVPEQPKLEPSAAKAEPSAERAAPSDDGHAPVESPVAAASREAADAEAREPAAAERGGWPLFVVVGRGSQFLAYWRFDAQTRARVQLRLGAGSPMARVLFFTATQSDVHRSCEDYPLLGDAGQFGFSAPSDDSVVRAVLGWQATAGSFTPLAVAALASLEQSAVRLIWKPRPGFDEQQAVAEVADSKALSPGL